jgi:hypothetical protein
LRPFSNETNNLKGCFMIKKVLVASLLIGMAMHAPVHAAGKQSGWIKGALYGTGVVGGFTLGGIGGLYAGAVIMKDEQKKNQEKQKKADEKLVDAFDTYEASKKKNSETVRAMTGEAPVVKLTRTESFNEKEGALLLLMRERGAKTSAKEGKEAK